MGTTDGKTAREDALWRARKKFFGSYVHKLLIVTVALAAFRAVTWLGQKSDKYASDQTAGWALSDATVEGVADEAARIVTAATIDARRKAKAPLAEQTTKAADDEDNQLIGDAKHLIEAVRVSLLGQPERPLKSRAELVTAIEERVDAHIWGQVTLGLDERLHTSKPEDRERVVREAQIAAQARISAAHAMVEASVPSKATGAPTPPDWQQMFDAKKPFYVIFQIIWYALLLIAVLSISYLLMILFAAIPGTPAESYWTKKITDILGGAAPGVAKAITPLLGTALIAGAVLAPAGYATAPGGLSRHETVVRERTIDGTTRVDNSQTIRDERKIDNSVGDTVYRVDTVFDQRLNAMELRLVEVIGKKAPLAPDLEPLRRATVQVARNVDGVSHRQWRLEQEVGLIRSHTEQTLPIAIQAGATALDVHKAQQLLVGQVTKAESDIGTEQAAQNKILTNARLQSIEADTRGFWPRNFGTTRFHLGPAIADGMSKSYDPEGTCDKRKRDGEPRTLGCQTVQAIRAMVAFDPASRGEFRDELIRQLDTAGLDETARNAFLDEQFNRLLLLSALRRY